MLHTAFKVSNGTTLSGALVQYGGEVRLSGTTHPFAPAGTLIENFSVAIPADDGLNAMAFFYRNPRPREMRSGKHTWVDNSVEVKSVLLLIFREGEKLFAKEVDDNFLQATAATATDVGRFNEFSKTRHSLSVSDTTKKVIYTDSPVDVPADPAWTYKRVPTGTLLQYICKRITLADLGAQAYTPYPSYTELLQRNAELGYQRDSLRVQLDAQQEGLDAAEGFAEHASEELKRVRAELESTLEQLAEKKAALKTATEANFGYRNQTRDMLPLLDRLEKFPKWLLSGDSIMFLHAMRALKASNKI